MPSLRLCKPTYLIFLLATTIAAQGQIFTKLTDFDGTNLVAPGYMSLVQGADGDAYGTTSYGGENGGGTVFRATENGTATVMYSFCSQPSCADGEAPGYDSGAAGGLVLDTDGYFYGATPYGGVSNCGEYEGGCGTIFKVARDGTLSTVHAFTNSGDGARPGAALVQAIDGNLYGVVEYGNTGTFFRITREGSFATLYTFCKQPPTCRDGAYPTGLLQASDGNFYGTTVAGGANGKGTVFRITTGGTLTTLYSFCAKSHCEDGAQPAAGLVQATDGSFYGTTELGGRHSDLCRGIFSYGCGTIFRIMPTGKLTTVYAFCAQPGCADGKGPMATLIQGTDGNFYGTTTLGGNGPFCSPGVYCGTVFTITPGGAFTTLHSFCSETGCGDGSGPRGGLLQLSNGIIYGTTENGGSFNGGTIFSVDMGLARFVRFVRNPAKVGQTFGILGQGLTGTTSVLLNGTPANFTVKSDTLLTAKVPSGATSGYVTVTTPSGTLTSNVPFQVIP